MALLKLVLKKQGVKVYYWEDLRVDGMALLKLVLKKRGIKVTTGKT